MRPAAELEEIRLADGHSYNLTTDDATVAAGKILALDASDLTSGHSLTLDASAETDGGFNILGGVSDDSFTINGPAVLAASQIDGGEDPNNSIEIDTLTLKGTFSSFTFAPDTIHNIETLVLGTNTDYDLTIDAANLSLFQSLTVDARGLDTGHHLIFDGSAETNGHFWFKSGNGADDLTGSQSRNTFEFTGLTTITSATRDTLNAVDFDIDLFRFGSVTGIDTAVTGGALTTGSFDSDLTAAVSSLQPHHAILFTPDTGDFVGQTFLVVDHRRATPAIRAGRLRRPAGNENERDPRPGGFLLIPARAAELAIGHSGTPTRAPSLPLRRSSSGLPEDRCAPGQRWSTRQVDLRSASRSEAQIDRPRLTDHPHGRAGVAAGEGRRRPRSAAVA